MLFWTRSFWALLNRHNQLDNVPMENKMGTDVQQRKQLHKPEEIRFKTNSPKGQQKGHNEIGWGHEEKVDKKWSNMGQNAYTKSLAADLKQ